MKMTRVLRNISVYLCLTACCFFIGGSATPLWGQDEGAQQADGGGGDEEGAGTSTFQTNPARLADLRLAEMIDRALRHNPEIRVAESQVQGAEAELNRTRLAITKEVIHLSQALSTQKKLIELAKERLKALEELAALIHNASQNAGLPISDSLKARIDLQDAQQALVASEARLAELEAQLPYLLGGQVSGFGAMGGGSGAGFGFDSSMMESQEARLNNHQFEFRRNNDTGAATDEGDAGDETDAGNENTAQAELHQKNWTLELEYILTTSATPAEMKLHQALSSPTELELIETPLTDVFEFLSELHGIRFIVADRAFEMSEVDIKEQTITLILRDVQLGAALQAIEDKTATIRFFVRDYGILVMPVAAIKDDKDNGFGIHEMIPFRDFWKGRRN